MSVNKKQEIIDLVKEYTTDNIFDITRFRKDHPKLYSSISYYFGSINSLLEELQVVKIQKAQQSNRVTLRNRLAYEMLVELRKTHTYESIAQKYNVSRSSISQLFQALELSIKVEDLKDKID